MIITSFLHKIHDTQNLKDMLILEKIRTIKTITYVILIILFSALYKKKLPYLTDNSSYLKSIIFLRF